MCRPVARCGRLRFADLLRVPTSERLRSFIVAAVVVVAAIFAAAAHAEVAITAETVAQGNAQFHRTCAQCHGRNLVSSGTSAPDLRKFPVDQEPRYLASVFSGKGNMPAFKEHLSAEQIATIWAYIATRGGKEMPEPPSADKAPPKADSAPVNAVAAPLAFTVCMAEDSAPLSFKDKARQPQGFDVRVAQMISASLGRPLRIVMFESKFEMESTLSQEVNALLASGVCDVASGFPLIETDLGAPSRATARVPDYPGARRRPDRAWVPLVPIAATQAYHVSTLSVVTRASVGDVNRLDALRGLRLGATAGSLAGTILSTYKNGLLRANVASLSRDANVFAELEGDRIDAALTATNLFDAWKIDHVSSTLKRSNYVHPLKINIGFVVRADAKELLAAMNVALTRAFNDGTMQRLANDAVTTWIAPAEPNVRGAIGIADVLGQ